MSPDARQDFAFSFLSILFEGAPFILLGTLVSGFIDVFLPAGAMDRLLPKRRLPAILVAGLLGAILPVCECAVVPVIRRLVKKGLPVSCALTYMLAAPIVNPITALSTWKAFQNAPVMIGHTQYSAGVVMVISRLVLGYLVSVLVGIVVSRVSLARLLRQSLVDSLPKEPVTKEQDVHLHDEGECGCGHDHHHPHEHRHDVHPAGSRLVAAFRSAMRDFIDVGVYFVVGMIITALFNTGIAPGAAWLDSLAQNGSARPPP